MSNKDKTEDILVDKVEAEELYQVYLRVQSGEKTALNELFKTVGSKRVSRVDEINEEYRMSHMDNVLDSELVLENEKNQQKEDWINSVNSKVTFQFSCLNWMLYKKKKKFISKAKNTGYENGQKIKNSNCSKYYEGEYDISDFNELMYETIIEIFNEKTDENNFLTLDGKKNGKYPICDGVSLLKNISYFTSRKINKRAKNSHLDIFDIGYCSEESGAGFSSFDKYAFKKFIESGRGFSRLAIYTEYLEWLERYDVHKLFKVNARDIHTIINIILDDDDVFMKDMSGDQEIGFGMRFITQEELQKIIKSRYGINIEQENISKDMRIIEQRLLDHQLYSLSYSIGKAEVSKGIYEKESERFLYELEEKAYIKMFRRVSYELYDKSVGFINNNDFDDYFRMVNKYEDMVIGIVSLEKGKKKYNMVNLILENDDLVDDERETLINIAKTVIAYYQKKEDEYRRNELGDYGLSKSLDWVKGYWEAELENEFLNIKLWSSENVKKPIQKVINKERLMVYYGYVNFYFCDVENKVCYRVPKDRRIISRSNKNHEIFMYGVG